MNAPQPAGDRGPKLHVLLATNDLRAAITRLIDPVANYRQNRFTETPALYDQLHGAVFGTQTNAGTGGGSKSRPPFWVDAYDKIKEIDVIVHTEFRAVRGGNTESQLRSLAGQNWTGADMPAVRRMTRIINAWADEIDALVNHETVRYLRDTECPACRTKTIQKRDSSGEIVRSPALKIDTENGAMCQNCTTHWEPRYFLNLIDQLGIPRPDGVLQ
ncbi:hypothetical protein BH11ACT6_BH11ACT6_34700 [soil metagenome]